MTFDSDAPEIAWKDVQVVALGKPIARIKGVKFSAKKEKELAYGRGANPLFIACGNKSYEGEIKLYQSEVEAMQRQLNSDEDLTDLKGFDITIAFRTQASPIITTYILKGVQFTEDHREMEQGDKYMEITLPIIFLRRQAA